MIESWRGDLAALQAGRAVLIGFPQDEGVRRNGGRPGAAQAPDEIRRWLDRLTPADPACGIDLAGKPPLDLGNVRITVNLEQTQHALAEVVCGVLQAGAVPVVLGGGHETAFGHYLGYAAARRRVGIINVDAHLDLRPCPDGGHSGTPFRQALEYAAWPLTGGRYVCLGVQPHNTSREHWLYARERGCAVHWHGEPMPLEEQFAAECGRLASNGCQVYVTIDADSVRAADVPAVSAPNPVGFAGGEVADCARLAGLSPAVSSLDLVEINPRFDRDGQSARWAAVVVWNFLMGLASRATPERSPPPLP